MRGRMTRALIVTTLCLAAVAVGLYLAEAYFAYETYDIELGTGERVRRAAIAAGADWDERSKVEILRDLRADGKDAFPAFAPSVYWDDDGLPYKGGRLMPFTGVSGAWTVFCQEMGPWMVYQADEHGFNNTGGLYQPDMLQAVLIGDSFAHGACVPEGEDIAGVMRRAGHLTMSLGIGGTGPMTYLAVQREYARPLRPRTVFWIYYAVDIRDPISEEHSAILRRYLDDPTYNQNLINRQPELDAFMRSFLDNEFAQRLDQLRKRRSDRTQLILNRLIREGLVLTRVRERLRNMGGRDVVTEGREEEKLNLLKRILTRAKAEAESWGGRFVFVYIPDWYAYAAQYDTYGIKIDDNFLLRQDVLKLVASLDIPIIDIQGEIFDKEKDPLALYNWRMYGHYTPEGYRLIGERLSKWLEGNREAPMRSPAPDN